ncbi:MAG: DegV family protein [Eubacterium sp.]|nr:DegV family protein [Eubacterium sp.]
MHTAIVTDTNSGMSIVEGERRGIFVLPMPVIIDGDMRLEGVNVSYSEVFRAMAEHKNVSTSQPSPGEVHDMWKKIFEKGYDELVYIPMSSGLSSSYASAKGLARDFGEKVQVVDNHRISLTLYESVLDAKALADQGKSAKQIRERLEEQTSDATIYLTVNSIEYLKKSGRITDAGIALAKLLKIKPVLTIQGERLDAFAKTRGILAAEKKMILATFHDLQERFYNTPKEHILVGAAGTLLTKEEIRRWSEKIKEAFPGYPFLYHPLSCSIACHTGPGAMGTGFVFMDRGWSGVGEG